MGDLCSELLSILFSLSSSMEGEEATNVEKAPESESGAGLEVKNLASRIETLGKVKVETSTELHKTVVSKDAQSDEEEDEPLPPRLRFVTPADVVDETIIKNPETEEIYYGTLSFELENISPLTAIVVGTSGLKVTVVTGLDHLKKLYSLCLRSNFIRQVSEVATLTTLTSLELYENRLVSLDGVEHLVNLTNLDLSYNRLRSIDPKIFE